MKKTLCSVAALTLLASGSAFAHKEGDFIVRGGLAAVLPNDSSDAILDSSEELKVNSDIQLGLTLGYMITDNISVELLAATPFKHDIDTNLVAPSNIADTQHLPPTLMVQYYFGQAESKVRPYVGAGINYTFFFNEGFNDNGKAAGLDNLKLDDSWGLAANLGVDYKLTDDWFLNASVWYIDIDTEASYTAGGTKYTTDVEIDPWVLMVGGGYKF
ncbi:MAG: outer membrane protein OmpW [Vibrio sp.]|uniref:outer membrane protein OmpW n=1 Tax=Vibrio sp. TaxID=678 RepID=UPI003A87C3DC